MIPSDPLRLIRPMSDSILLTHWLFGNSCGKPAAVRTPVHVCWAPSASAAATLSRNSSYGIGFVFGGRFHHGLRHLGQTRGSSSVPPRGIHSWAQRSHRNPKTVIGTIAIGRPPVRSVSIQSHYTSDKTALTKDALTNQ